MKNSKIKVIIWGSGILLVIFALWIISCGSLLPTVIPIDENSDTKAKKGIFYSLPKTLIRIEIPIISTTEIPGPLFENKEWFYEAVEKIGLTTDEITKTESTTYRLGDAAISTITLPDENNTFFIELDVGRTKDLNLTLQLNKEGLLESAKSDSTDRAFDIGVKLAKSTASIAGKMIGAPPMTALTPDKRKMTKRDKVEQNIIEIDSIRKSRLLLISGPLKQMLGGFHPDTLKLMLTELDKKEQQLTNALRGITTEKEWTAIFEIEPKTIDTGAELLHFSDRTGIAKLGGYCVNDFSNPFKIISDETADLIEMRISAKKQPATIIGPNDKNIDGSFFYRIPVQTHVEIKRNKKTFIAENVHLAHLGPIRQLPKDFKSKFALLDLSFYTDTGGIKKFDTQLKAGDIGEAVESISTSAGEMTEKILKVDQELLVLERKKKILELKNQIKQLEQEKNNGKMLQLFE
jgi:hypothetical protein